ncbi:hypothetical protein FGO68_gene8295 [Halteria grandinella]|uniref:Uncharacterized protein n=1 Tax=Halteria grandinella TaxID=5974 RepID=A0A8J8T599_HALGN|nr:hypothetical protein FGO68_gene8295 [Halteria grandinella]
MTVVYSSQANRGKKSPKLHPDQGLSPQAKVNLPNKALTAKDLVIRACNQSSTPKTIRHDKAKSLAIKRYYFKNQQNISNLQEGHVEWLVNMATAPTESEQVTYYRTAAADRQQISTDDKILLRLQKRDINFVKSTRPELNVRQEDYTDRANAQQESNQNSMTHLREWSQQSGETQRTTVFRQYENYLGRSALIRGSPLKVKTLNSTVGDLRAPKGDQDMTAQHSSQGSLNNGSSLQQLMGIGMQLAPKQSQNGGVQEEYRKRSGGTALHRVLKSNESHRSISRESLK